MAWSTILSLPTSPFREQRVLSALRDLSLRASLPSCFDPYGNLWIGASRMSSAHRARLVVVAHADHPGFVLTSTFRTHKGRREVLGKWLGGGPLHLAHHQLDLFSSPIQSNGSSAFGPTLPGRITEWKNNGKRSVDTAWISVQAPTHELRALEADLTKGHPWGACLHFSHLPRGWIRQGDRLITKAADDLAGAILAMTALSHARRLSPDARKAVLVITRGEESGFHGTMEVLKSKKLNPRSTAMLSIETSSWLPGAEPGKGVILRQGDRSQTFHGGMVAFMQSLAVREKVPFQKRIMDGGSCEASAFAAYGFRVAGLSLPLEGYHNIHRRNPGGRPVAESIRISDLHGATHLLTALLCQTTALAHPEIQENALATFRRSLEKNHKDHKQYWSSRPLRKSDIY